MSTTFTRRAVQAAAVLTVAASIAAAAPSAHAETTTITDRVGDSGRFTDIASVTTSMNGRTARVVTEFAPRVHFSDQVVVFFDTAGRSDGAEYAAIIDTDAFGTEQTRYDVREASGFETFGEPVCTPRNARVETRGPDSITLPVPTRCLQGPDQVRVSVESSQYVGGRGDYAPGRHRFGDVTHLG